MHPPINVLGTPIQSCSRDPLTGWYRDGCCNTDDNDHGRHTVCAHVTQDFLEYICERGNDLITPVPAAGFPGLKPGDQWCVCANSWRDAHLQGKGCPVVLESTHTRTLQLIPLEELMEHALADEA